MLKLHVEYSKLTHNYVKLVFLPGLRPGSLKNFADLTRTYIIAFQFITRNFVPTPVFSKRSRVTISKAPY